MSNIVGGGNLEARSGHEMKRGQRAYKVHNEVSALNSELCSTSLSGSCRSDRRNQDHVVFQEDTAADRYGSRLAPITKELEMVDIELDQISNSLKEAKSICQRQANAIKTTISEAAQSIINLVRRREQELHLGVDQKKATVMKQISDTEIQKMELSLSTDNMKGTCEQLKADIAKQDFKRTAVIELLPGRSAILQREISELKSVMHTGAIGLSFERASPNTAIPVGCLRDRVHGKQLQISVGGGGAGKMESLVKLQSINCQHIKQLNLKAFYKSLRDLHLFHYQGFSLLTVNSMILSFLQEDRLIFVWLKGGTSPLVKDIRFGGESVTMTPVGGNGGHGCLVYNKSTIFKVMTSTFPPNIYETRSVTLSDALLYDISAVCWDEQLNNCYTLLHDGRTIKKFLFDSNKSEAFVLKLNEKVKCSSPYGFQVAEFGMAICDEEKYEVRYYHTVRSPEAMCVVKAPQKIKGARPVCVTSRKQDKKWIVVWHENVKAGFISQTHSSIYQYSVSFQDEYLLLDTTEDVISSLGILDDKYMCIQTHKHGYTAPIVSVYYIQSNN